MRALRLLIIVENGSRNEAFNFKLPSWHSKWGNESDDKRLYDMFSMYLRPFHVIFSKFQDQMQLMQANT
jgi:hypothetical protein